MVGQEDGSNSAEILEDNHGKSVTDSIKNRFESFDRVATIDAIIASPGKFKRELSSMSATNILTRFPLITVLGCILLTFVIGLESGMNDCRRGWSSSDDNVEGNQWYGAGCSEEPSLNVNGDLEVYLPEDSPITGDIARIQNNWTTNVMVYMWNQR